MESLVVRIPIEKITDWPSFHRVFQEMLGFPSFYGKNMDAWIDCMTSIDTPEAGMSTVTVKPGQLLVLQIDDPFGFKARCPKQYDALVECTAFVNFRRTDLGETNLIALLFNGPTVALTSATTGP